MKKAANQKVRVTTARFRYRQPRKSKEGTPARLCGASVPFRAYLVAVPGSSGEAQGPGRTYSPQRGSAFPDRVELGVGGWVEAAATRTPGWEQEARSLLVVHAEESAAASLVPGCKVGAVTPPPPKRLQEPPIPTLSFFFFFFLGSHSE